MRGKGREANQPGKQEKKALDHTDLSPIATSLLRDLMIFVDGIRARLAMPNPTNCTRSDDGDAKPARSRTVNTKNPKAKSRVRPVMSEEAISKGGKKCNLRATYKGTH